MAKRPAFQHYIGDWFKDPCLSKCGPATRGIWFDLLCAMHEMNDGAIEGTVTQLARVARCSEKEMSVAIEELEATGTADVQHSSVTRNAEVTDCHKKVTLVCRRLARESKARKDGRKRQRRYRKKRDGDEDVTPPSSSSSSASTKKERSSNDGDDAGSRPGPLSASRLIWDIGVSMLVESGMRENHARSVLGKWAKEYGNETLSEAIAVTSGKNPVNPVEFLKGVLKARKYGTNSGNKGKPGYDEIFDEAREYYENYSG